MTDERGREVGRYSYYAFGVLRAASGFAAGGNERRFTGEGGSQRLWSGAAGAREGNSEV